MKLPDKIRKFQVVKFLGNGNFGFVFQVYDPLLKADRAIKLIKVPNPTKFVEAVNEAQTLEVCRHKHIVDVKEVDITTYEGTPCVYIAMEYLAKGSIQTHLETRFISIKESLKIISDSLLGLEHAHNSNVLHRDIKPGNILFGDNGEAKLSDFGLALDYHVDPSDTMGYRPHQPLEVIEGNPMDKVSDIYAMGITLYRLLNNIDEVKFTFQSLQEWKKAVKSNNYPKREYLPHIPKKVINIVNKAIHNNLKTRYKSVSEFRRAIEKISLHIDWTPLNDNEWFGSTLNSDTYTIKKIKKRTGWSIDFKKKNRRILDKCFKDISDKDIEEIFFETMRDA